MIGPNCFGVAVPGVALDATFGASHPATGTAGLAVQSGGVGIALAGQLSRLGIGISSFASLGDKCDVSGNDLLTWWDHDAAGAVQLDLHGHREVRAGYRALAGKFGARMPGAIIQPMITGGTEVIMGVVQEPVFGPLVVFGLGGVATDVLG